MVKCAHCDGNLKLEEDRHSLYYVCTDCGAYFDLDEIALMLCGRL